MTGWSGSPSSIRAEIQFYQFLPLYDVIHLGNVMRRGYSPTSSEMTWALVDGCFVVADVLSLAAIQPEGAIAAESVRAEVKAAVRAGCPIRRPRAGRDRGRVRRQGRRSPRAGSSGLERAGAGGSRDRSRRWARWWTVRSAGGMYQVLRQVPGGPAPAQPRPADGDGRTTRRQGRHAAESPGNRSGCSKTEPRWCCASRRSAG